VEASRRLQKADKYLFLARYGERCPYCVKVDLEFQQPGLLEADRHARFVIVTATLFLFWIPGTILLDVEFQQPGLLEVDRHASFVIDYNFLGVVRGYRGGSFRSKASHVLQVSVQSFR
jgi:hypothetical protein